MKKISIALSALCALALCCGFTIRQQAKEWGQTKIGIRNHVYQAPLEIVGLKVEGKKVKAGQDLLTARDWIKQLTITVKNTSDRDLIGVGASIEFPYDGEQPLLPEIEFQAGLDPVTGLGANDFVLSPGETAELTLAEGWLKFVDMVVEMAGKLNRPDLVHRVTAQPTLAAFSVDEVWRRGAYKRRASDTKWNVDKEAMKRVSLETRRYWQNVPRMQKASARTPRCVCEVSSENLACTQVSSGSCPTCIFTLEYLSDMAPGWPNKFRFIPCTDINGNCGCLKLVEEINYAAAPC